MRVTPGSNNRHINRIKNTKKIPLAQEQLILSEKATVMTQKEDYNY